MSEGTPGDVTVRHAARPPPATRNGKGGKPGKRPGAPGSGLAWREVPDETVAHHPVGVCGCGTDLADAVDEGVARSHQVHEVPLQREGGPARPARRPLSVRAPACRGPSR